MINLILKQDPRDFVTDELCRLDRVVAIVQIVVLQRAGCDSELEVSAGFHVGVADGAAPHLERVGEHAVFGGGLLVFAVVGFVEALRPGVAVVPVEGT